LLYEPPEAKTTVLVPLAKVAAVEEAKLAVAGRQAGERAGCSCSTRIGKLAKLQALLAKGGAATAAQKQQFRHLQQQERLLQPKQEHIGSRSGQRPLQWPLRAAPARQQQQQQDQTQPNRAWQQQKQ